MASDERLWLGHAVHTPEARWVCIESKEVPVSSSPDAIDFYLTFAAHDPKTTHIPERRNLHLRTSSFKISEEPGFVGFLTLVVDGQMLQTTPWDRSIEIFEKD